MSDQTVMITLPEATYAHLRETAARSNRSLEEVLPELATLFFAPVPERDASLETLATYSDDQLWRVVHMRLPVQQEQRLERLTEQAKTHGLSAHEQAEADALVNLIEQQMALRSEALLLLQKRDMVRQ